MNIIKQITSFFKSKQFLVNFVKKAMGILGVESYWTNHNVTGHALFNTAQESLEYFHWRNDQYFKYIELMPVDRQDNKVILDYGCGPGNDLVGFGIYSSPKKLIGADISSSSLLEASERLKLHNIDSELVKINQDDESLPFDDDTFDHIHSSGVLHHTPDPIKILKEFKRILKPGGTINIMVYNYHSIWAHLYVAYQRTILNGMYKDGNFKEQFRRSTDGENCPISNCYTSDEWIKVCAEGGLEAKCLGAAVSMHEMKLMDLRFQAIQNIKLPKESREFLLSLTFDEKGYPKYKENYAGIDMCFQVVHKKLR